MKAIINLSLVLSVVFLQACVSAPKGPQILELKSPQAVSTTAYRSNSVSKEYSEGQLIKDKSDFVEFVVETRPSEKSSAPVEMVLKTIEKNGVLPLHDYGFPELSEEVDFQYSKSGQVLKAGNFHPMSLFYVPPIPLPKVPVEKGDTWDLTHQWMSESGMELKLNVIGIHKGYQRCGKSSPCVNIEISGTVTPADDRIVGIELKSLIAGNLLFSIKDGEVYSSKVRSDELIQLPEQKIESKSCMVSTPVAQGQKLKNVSFAKCPVD